MLWTKTKKSPAKPPKKQFLSILIVDDVKVNRYILNKFIRKIIGTEKHTVHEAHSGEEALNMAESLAYDLVFMDIRMPGMDGIETTKRLKSKYPNIVVCGTTGQVEKAVINEAITAGMLTCVGKPLQLADIKRVLDELLSEIK